MTDGFRVTVRQDSAGYQLSWSSEEGKPLGRKA